MHGKQIHLALVILGLAATAGLAQQAHAQQATAIQVNAPAAQPQGQFEELDEVVVRGGRLYDQIIQAEDRFFKLYNELNKDDDFDTNCAYLRLDTDTQIEQRVCMPSFYADAKAEQIRLNVFCNSLNSYDEEGQLLSRGTCYEPPPAELVFYNRRDAYVKNVMAVIRSDPRLQRMAEELDGLHRERDALSHRYDEIVAEQKAIKADGRTGPRGR